MTSESGPRYPTEAAASTEPTASVPPTGNRFQLLPPLSTDDYAALLDSIRENGILVPVELDQDGNVIDGHHRLRAAAELGITDVPTVVREYADDEARRRRARVLNLARRHLTREQRRQLIAKELAADPSRSDREIGRLLGVDHKTVGSTRRQGGEIPQGGSIYPPPASTPEEAERRRQAIVMALVKLDLSVVMSLGEGADRAHILNGICSALVREDLPDEAAETWWQHVIQPRIDGVYAWPDGWFRRVALDSLTWPEWPDYDAELAEAAERELSKMDRR